jgi:outer membrane protein TolC
MHVRVTRSIWVSLATIGALLSPLSLRAADEEPADAVRLSLNEALSRSLEQNLDLAIAKKDPDIAFQDVLFQKAAFDPLFEANIQHTEQTSEPSQVFVGSESKQDQMSAGFSGLLNFGATWSAGLQSSRLDSNSAFNSYNPSYNSGLALTFRMPFLRGLGKEATTAALVISKRNLDISHEELRRQATNTLRTVEDAYWNLRAAREAQRVAEQTLKLSQDLYDLNKKKVEVGTLAPIEITQAEANVASNVELTIRSKEAVANAEDNLRHLLAIPKDDPMWTHTIIPTEEPVKDARSVELDAAIAKALEARPEMIEARSALENSQLSERAAHNAAKHQLDLNAGVTPSGNNLIDVLPGPDGIPGTSDDVTQTGGLTDSYKEIPKFNNYLWTLGLTYSVPIANRAAKANYAIATISREKQEISVKNTEDIIRVDVRTAARAVEAGFERVTAGRKNVELQTKKLDAEQKKFDNGMSTSFEVFTFQTDLRNAQLSLIQALLDYNKSLADLERAKGTLLESKGLQLAADAGR